MFLAPHAAQQIADEVRAHPLIPARRGSSAGASGGPRSDTQTYVVPASDVDERLHHATLQSLFSPVLARPPRRGSATVLGSIRNFRQRQHSAPHVEAGTRMEYPQPCSSRKIEQRPPPSTSTPAFARTQRSNISPKRSTSSELIPGLEDYVGVPRTTGEVALQQLSVNPPLDTQFFDGTGEQLISRLTDEYEKRGIKASEISACELTTGLESLFFDVVHRAKHQSTSVSDMPTEVPIEQWIFTHDANSLVPPSRRVPQSNAIDCALRHKKGLVFPSAVPWAREELYCLAKTMDDLLSKVPNVKSLCNGKALFPRTGNQLLEGSSTENVSTSGTEDVSERLERLLEYITAAKEVWQVLSMGLREISRALRGTWPFVRHREALDGGSRRYGVRCNGVLAADVAGQCFSTSRSGNKPN